MCQQSFAIHIYLANEKDISTVEPVGGENESKAPREELFITWQQRASLILGCKV